MPARDRHTVINMSTTSNEDQRGLGKHVIPTTIAENAKLASTSRSLGFWLMMGTSVPGTPINEVWDDPKHLRQYTPESLRAILLRNGLTPIQEWQVDRWSSFLLPAHLNQPSLFKRFTLRALRGLLAVLPYRAVEWGESLLLGGHKPQQLVVLSVKS